MYSYFDAHCDTMSKMYKRGLGLDASRLMVNTENLSGYRDCVQVFALFNGGDMRRADMDSCFSYFKGECERLSDKVRLAYKADDLEKNSTPLLAILSIEGLGNQPDFKLSDISAFHDTGVRFMSLSWNNDNLLCGGCDGNFGLTELGRAALSEMERHRIILDVSHMSDKSFYDSLECYTLPIVATHSVSRAVYNHRRNLTDGQFLEIMRRGGVVGINFYPPFLTGDEADIDTVVLHIEHFMALGGEGSLGLGSDFDGIDKAPKGLETSAYFYRLTDRLLALNYSDESVEGIMYKNFKRLFKSFNM